MEGMVTTDVSSPVGRLRLAATDGGACTVGTNHHLRQWREQLAAYFRGTLQKFTVPLDLRGTDLRLKSVDAKPSD
jgi:O6-methylguanine-DNA--protein-cysteine methyltransferase